MCMGHVDLLKHVCIPLNPISPLVSSVDMSGNFIFRANIAYITFVIYGNMSSIIYKLININ